MARKNETRDELLEEIARLRRTVDRLTGQTPAVSFPNEPGAARLTPRPAPAKVPPLIDDLTQIYNRPAFVTIANQRLKAITRREVPTTLITFGLEGVEDIHSRLGGETMEDARRAAGTLIRETFRESDLVGRLDDDTFAVLAVDAAEDAANLLLERFQLVLEGWNGSTAKAPYRLAVGARFAGYTPDRHASVEDLLAEADEA